jgi:hypothetical protein
MFANKDLTRFDALEEQSDTETTKTPYDEDFFIKQDKMPQTEQNAILALQEFESSVTYLFEKKYEQSEQQLKQALKILKNA